MFINFNAAMVLSPLVFNVLYHFMHSKCAFNHVMNCSHNVE